MLKKVRSLDTTDVDRLLQTAVGRCAITQCANKSVTWVGLAEQDSVWERQIKSRLAFSTIRYWLGYYEAWEWRTDQNETIIEFMNCFVPV